LPVPTGAGWTFRRLESRLFLVLAASLVLRPALRRPALRRPDA
jgi:hypothetical protein